MDDLPFHDEDGNSSDDAIEKKKDCKGLERSNSSYKPIDQESSWFEHIHPKDKDEQLTITKFKAHSTFKKEDYHKALSLYEECRKLLPSNANLLLREVCESQARCLIKIGRYNDAESILNMLVDEKGNPQDSTLQALLTDVYIATGNLEAAADCLKKCLDLHPDYPSYFLKVADLYINLQKSEESFQRHHDARVCERIKSDCVSDERNGQGSVWYFVDMFLENMKQSLERKKILVNEENVIDNSMRDFSITNNEKDKDTSLNNFDEKKTLPKSQESIADSIENQKDSGGKLSSLVENILKNNASDDVGTCYYVVQALSVMKDEMFQKEFICHCTEYVLKFLKCMNSQDQRAFGQGQLLFHTNRALEGEERNGIISNLSTNIENIHRTTWKLLMKLPQIFATVKAWSLLQKSVLYSKGFGKICEEKKLFNVEQKAVNLLGSKANVKILAQVLENGQFMEKQAPSKDRQALNSN